MKYRFVPYISAGNKWFRIEYCEVERGLFSSKEVWRYHSICSPEDVEACRQHLEQGIQVVETAT